MKQERPQVKVLVPSSRTDWILLISRWSIGLVFLLWNRLLPPVPDAQSTLQGLLLIYLVLTLLEAIFLWRVWGMGVWPYITLSLDIVLVLVILFQTGGANSPLLLLLLLPVAATSLRLGFYSGLGMNLVALVGYILLIVTGQVGGGQEITLLEAGLLGGIIVAIGVFGGLLAEQIGAMPKAQLERFQVQVRQLESQCDSVGRQAQAFYDMSHTLSVTMNYQRVVEGILQQCRVLLDFSVGVVLLSAGEEDLAIVASSGLRVNDTHRTLYLRGGEISNCLATAEPLLLESMGRDGELGQIQAFHRCRSGMGVPLRAGLRNYGVIVLGSINEQAYAQEDLGQLTALAHFATTAIQNAQLYQDLLEERDKIIRAEEDVRKELSRDLHDGPAQAAAAIAMSIEYIRRLLAEDTAAASEELNALERLARKTAWDIRTMLFELRPIILETKGLVPTMEQYVQRFPASEEPQVHLDTGGFDQRLDSKVEHTIFIIMQEAVNNARKHAKARNIWMHLSQEGDRLIASVQDDGVGFDLATVQDSYEERGSFGLLNMHERAERVGGKTEIRSAPGKGTAVIISISLKRE